MKLLLETLRQSKAYLCYAIDMFFFSYRTFHHRQLALLGARYLHLVHTDLECTQKVCVDMNAGL